MQQKNPEAQTTVYFF